MLKRWDIFCKVVDNFGDIGVCWRLARQLQVEHSLQIRLWIDDLEVAQKIIPNLEVEKNSQICDEITILKWPGINAKAQADFSHAADVVIEAFACSLPPAYLMAMTVKKSKWVNLEYLSAESWVDDFHAKPSPQSFLNSNHGLTRYFYFPGFTENTGGLICEADLIHKNQSLINSQQLQNKLWQSLNVSNFAALKISLFCYPHAPIGDLLDTLANSNQPINCYVPASSILPKIAQYFGKTIINIGDNIQHKNLQLQVLPFLSQADYDALLCACDINFVRGEDSWVRAIWAGKPFIWQPYFQAENTHIKKLDSFLLRFYGNLSTTNIVAYVFNSEIYQIWSSGRLTLNSVNRYLSHLPAIQKHTLEKRNQLLLQPDLATKLIAFCNKL